MGFISTGTRQYMAGKSGREILSIRKCAMNQRNKRGKAKGHVLQWFVVVVELKNSSKDPQQFCCNEWSIGKQLECQ